MKENDVQKVYWAAYEDGEVMESDDGILLISFDKETVEHYPSLPNQVLQVMICRPPTSRPVDAALKSPPEIEGEYTLEGNSAAFVYVCQDGKKIATVYGSGEEKLERGYTIINALNAALKSPPECMEGEFPEDIKENDGLEAVLAALDKLQNDLCSTEPGHLVEAYEAFETIRNYITGGNGMTASRPVAAALPHCPDGSIKIPESVEEAEAMEKIGFAYIKQHAPHRLTELGLQRASSKIAAAEGN